MKGVFFVKITKEQIDLLNQAAESLFLTNLGESVRDGESYLEAKFNSYNDYLLLRHNTKGSTNPHNLAKGNIDFSVEFYLMNIVGEDIPLEYYAFGKRNYENEKKTKVNNIEFGEIYRVYNPYKGESQISHYNFGEYKANKVETITFITKVCEFYAMFSDSQLKKVDIGNVIFKYKKGDVGWDILNR